MTKSDGATARRQRSRRHRGVALVSALALAVISPACAADREQGLGGTGAPAYQTSPAQAGQGGVGGTGAPVYQSSPGGLGGTGITGGDEDQGIGGTGVYAGGEDQGIGGTGIIGVITGFGSIIVNGLTVAIGTNTVVEDLDGPTRQQALQVGHLVEIEALEASDGTLTARGVAIRHDLAGPVEQIDANRAAVLVLGQWVYADPATSIATAPPGNGPASSRQATGLGQLSVGDVVRVSGLRRDDGALLATRIEPHPETSPFALRGTVSRVDQGGVEIDGIPVRWTGTRPARVGDRLLLRGDIEAGRLRAQRIKRLQDIPFEGRVRRLIVEGIAARRGQAGWGLKGYTLGDQAPTSSQGLRPGQRVIGEWRVGANRRLRLARALCRAQDEGRVSRLQDCSRLGTARPRHLRDKPGDNRPGVERPIRDKIRQLRQEQRERRLRRQEEQSGDPALPERWRERRQERIEQRLEERRERRRDRRERGGQN